MNFSRLAPSPPFPRVPPPGDTLLPAPQLGPSLLGDKVGLHQPLLPSLLQKVASKAGAACRRQCLCLGFSTWEEKLCFSREGGSQLKLPIRQSQREEAGFRLGLLGNGYRGFVSPN